MKTEAASAFYTAEEYERVLHGFFHTSRGQAPRFDLILLGMGTDGHIASLFPNSEVLNERIRCVVATWAKKHSAYRITLTLPVLNNAACVLVLVSGKAKTSTLQAVFQGTDTAARYPAQLLRPADGELIWIADKDAAQLLTDKISAGEN